MFDAEKFYEPDDPKIGELLGVVTTLKRWRLAGTGPAYYRLKGRVVYKGADLNRWIEQQRVG